MSILDRSINKSTITFEELRRRFRFDDTTGLFYRLYPVGGKKITDPCGTFQSDGYRSIKIDGIHYLAHRLAWFYHHDVWPSNEIDHVNCIKDDNRMINLRLSNRTENQRNVGIMRSNSSGYKGVSWYPKLNRWVAYIRVDKIRNHLGYFDTPEVAHAAYCRAAEAHFGEFARTA